MEAQSPQYWDELAAAFDDEPDHGLRDPAVRAAWLARLATWLLPSRATILDAGCGTGSLSILLTALGHEVTGIDWSAAMLARAALKAGASGQQATFVAMDAAHPSFSSSCFDVVLCRHVLWALPQPAAVLQRWANLLAPGGRLVLIEGYWSAGGLHAEEVVAALPPMLTNVTVDQLSGKPQLWGGPVNDERYAVIARQQ